MSDYGSMKAATQLLYVDIFSHYFGPSPMPRNNPPAISGTCFARHSTGYRKLTAKCGSWASIDEWLKPTGATLRAGAFKVVNPRNLANDGTPPTAASSAPIRPDVGAAAPSAPAE